MRFYLYVFSFLFQSQSGLALVSARTEREGFDILRRQGKNSAQGNNYRLVQTKNLGLYNCDRAEIVIETYTNAMVAFDAISKAMSSLSVVASSSIARYDTTRNWNRMIGFVPQPGEVIVYSDYKKEVVDGKERFIPGVKIGSGNAYVQDLAFINTGDSEEMQAHIQNTTIHITGKEREFWNNKLNVNDTTEVIEETLLINRN